MGLEPTTSPSTYHLQGKEVAIELELIGLLSIYVLMSNFDFRSFLQH